MAKTNAKPKTARKAPRTTRAKNAGRATKKAAAASKPAKRVQPPRSKATKPAAAPAKARPETKQAVLIAQMQRKEGATIDELVRATGWQAHSVRGAISGALKKKLGLAVTSEKIEGRGRVYRIAAGG
jgi:hypothetical protein